MPSKTSCTVRARSAPARGIARNVEQRIRFFGACRKDAALGVIFERAADAMDVVGDEREAMVSPSRRRQRPPSKVKRVGARRRQAPAPEIRLTPSFCHSFHAS